MCRDLLAEGLITADPANCPADLVMELTAERLQAKLDVRNTTRRYYEWHKIRANEAWDLLNYNFLMQRFYTQGEGFDAAPFVADVVTN